MTTAILEEHLPADRIESDNEYCYDLVDGELVERTMGSMSSSFVLRQGGPTRLISPSGSVAPGLPRRVVQALPQRLQSPWAGVLRSLP